MGNRHRHILLLGVLLGVVLNVGTSGIGNLHTQANRHSTVTLSSLNNVTDRMVLAVYARLLQEMGYDVEVKVLDFHERTDLYADLASGDVDITTSGWLPRQIVNQPESFSFGYLSPSLAREVSIAGAVMEQPFLQGYLVDRASVRQYGISDLSDFARAEVRQAFDITGDGKAELLGCPRKWFCGKVTNFHLNAYALRAAINHVGGSYGQNFATALERIRQGLPTLFFTWRPSHHAAHLDIGQDVLWINVPRNIPPEEGYRGFASKMTAKGIPGAVSEVWDAGFLLNDRVLIGNNQFLADHPDIDLLLRQATIAADWLSEAAYRIKQGGQPRDLAQWWMVRNWSLAREWMDRAREVTAGDRALLMFQSPVVLASGAVASARFQVVNPPAPSSDWQALLRGPDQEIVEEWSREDADIDEWVSFELPMPESPGPYHLEIQVGMLQQDNTLQAERTIHVVAR